MINVKWRGSEVKGEKALGQEEDREKGSNRERIRMTLIGNRNMATVSKRFNII